MLSLKYSLKMADLLIPQPVVLPEQDMQTPPQSPRAPNPKILWAPVKKTQVQFDPQAAARIAERGRTLFDVRDN